MHKLISIPLVTTIFLSRMAFAEVIDYPSLFKAIAQVESDRGATSRNVYQLTYSFVYDIERITGERLDYDKVTASRKLSERYMRIYWAYYSSRYFNKTGAAVTPALLAKIHHVGYKGLRTKPTAAAIYWVKVRKWYNLFKGAECTKHTKKGATQWLSRESQPKPGNR